MRFCFCFFAVVNPVLSSFFLGMGCPILGCDVWNVPSWDGMQESHPGMGCMAYPILGWDAIIPSWDGMYGISHLGMEIILPILGWDGKMGYPILGWDVPSMNGFFFLGGC